MKLQRMELQQEPSPMAEPNEFSQEEAESGHIVIIGAGIAGLAIALAFHRLGIKTLVLEKSDKLRPGGTSLLLWDNAWHALDTLQVSDELRGNYVNMAGFEILSEAGKLIHHASFNNNNSHELRAVERTALLEALAKPLPNETIRFNSKVAKISKAKEGSHTEIYLDDGTTIKSKVLIGCDGVHSVVAQWMGLKEPGFVGQYAIRGVAKYTGGSKFGSVFRQYLGRGVRAGIAPVSSDKIYWFMAFKNSKQGWMANSEGVKEEAKMMIKDWSSDSKEVMYDLIDNSPLETVSRSALRDRLILPFFTPKLVADGVALAGDALHPITPNLGQGGCLALEDSVILAREIYSALKTQEGFSQGFLSHALETYVNQRWKRFIPLAVESRLMGVLLTLNSPLLCYLRDAFLLPLLLRAFDYSSPTHFHCGALPVS